jgi:hypothetical protein
MSSMAIIFIQNRKMMTKLLQIAETLDQTLILKRMISAPHNGHNWLPRMSICSFLILMACTRGLGHGMTVQGLTLHLQHAHPHF